MKKKENILLIVGLLLLVSVLYFGSASGSNRIETEIERQSNTESIETKKPTDSVCRLDGLECLYVGCSDYY